MSNSQKTEKWIVDTDPGCDDMIAILYLIKRGCAEIMFLALSEGNCKMEHVELNAKKISHLVKSKIIGYKGSLNQLYHGAKNAYDYHYEDGLGGIRELQEINVDHIELNELSTTIIKNNDDNNSQITYKENSSIEIIKLVNKYPGEVNILCLAPTTNVALAYKLDPTIINKFKSIVIMGGSYDFRGNVTATSEFNFYHDFLSTQIFFNKFKNVLVLPWEPCEGLKFTTDLLEKSKERAINKFGSYNDHLFKYVELIINKYSTEKSGVEICDLYAIIAYFNYDSVKEFSLCKQRVIIDSDLHKGALCITDKIIPDISFSQLMEEYYKKGKEYKEGYNIYIDKMNLEEIVDEFSYIFRPDSK